MALAKLSTRFFQANCRRLMMIQSVRFGEPNNKLHTQRKLLFAKSLNTNHCQVRHLRIINSIRNCYYGLNRKVRMALIGFIIGYFIFNSGLYYSIKSIFNGVLPKTVGTPPPPVTPKG